MASTYVVQEPASWVVKCGGRQIDTQKLTARNLYAPSEGSNPAIAACRQGDSSERTKQHCFIGLWLATGVALSHTCFCRTVFLYPLLCILSLCLQ
jgi:hypothetical protein